MTNTIMNDENTELIEQNASMDSQFQLKFKRSRYGCFSCRKRKKRCDQVKPQCIACQRLNIPCVYPVPGTERQNRPRKSKSLDSNPELDRTFDTKIGSFDANDPNNEFINRLPAFMSNPNISKDCTGQMRSSMSTLVDFSQVGYTLSDNNDDSIFNQGRIFHNFDGQTDSNSMKSTSEDNEYEEMAKNQDNSVNQDNSISQDNSIDQHNTVNDEHSNDLSMILSTDSPDTMTRKMDLMSESFMSQDPISEFLIPWSPPTVPSLSNEAGTLFRYFTDYLAKLINIGGPINSFLSIFVPMAQNSEPVRDSIIAWAGFHRQDTSSFNTACKHLNKAIEGVVVEYNNYDYSTLAALLLISAAEICSGDLIHWHKHLSLAARIINKKGGLRHFLKDKTLTWLASNFSYHDLLASSICSRRPHFPPSDYDELFQEGATSGPDSLIGCCQPIFLILAEISSLAAELRLIYKCIDEQSVSQLEDIVASAYALEDKINTCAPLRSSTIVLTIEELDQQLVLFDVLRLTAKLHLKQSVLRENSKSLPMQCLHGQLQKALKQVLNTPVEPVLVFSLFISGTTSCYDNERMSIIRLFNEFFQRNKAGNIERARQLVEEVWKRDQNGSVNIDWYGIISRRGWDINFA